MFLTWSYFDFYIFSDTDLSNILGDPLLQVSTWYSKLHSLAWPPFCPVLSAIKHTVQWVRVGHTCFLYWPLPGGTRTDLYCNKQAEKQWRWWEAVERSFKSVFIVSKVDTSCDFLLHGHDFVIYTALVHCRFLLKALWSINWLIDWLTNWPTSCLFDWYFEQSFERSVDRSIPINWPTDRPTERTKDRLTNRTIDRLTYWSLLLPP